MSAWECANKCSTQMRARASYYTRLTITSPPFARKQQQKKKIIMIIRVSHPCSQKQGRNSSRSQTTFYHSLLVMWRSRLRWVVSMNHWAGSSLGKSRRSQDKVFAIHVPLFISVCGLCNTYVLVHPPFLPHPIPCVCVRERLPLASSLAHMMQIIDEEFGKRAKGGDLWIGDTWTPGQPDRDTLTGDRVTTSTDPEGGLGGIVSARPTATRWLLLFCVCVCE